MATKKRKTLAEREEDAERKVKKAAEEAAAIAFAVIAIGSLLALLALFIPGMVVVALLQLPFRVFGHRFDSGFLLFLAAACSLGLFIILWRRSGNLKEAARQQFFIGAPVLLVMALLAVFDVGWAKGYFSIFFVPETAAPLEAAAEQAQPPATDGAGDSGVPPIREAQSSSLLAEAENGQPDSQVEPSAPPGDDLGEGSVPLASTDSRVDSERQAKNAEEMTRIRNEMDRERSYLTQAQEQRARETRIHDQNLADMRRSGSNTAGEITYFRERTAYFERTIGEKQDRLDALTRELRSISGEETVLPAGAAGAGMSPEGAATDARPAPVAYPTAASVPSQPQTPADVAWENGDWNSAFTLYSEGATAGQPEAQVRIGRMYYDGLGRPVDFLLAEQWYRKAADKGSAEGKFRLGLLYSDGRKGAPWDLAIARQFLAGAAERHADAALKLGYFFWRGIGVEQDVERARGWYVRAAELGNTEATTWLKAHP